MIGVGFDEDALVEYRNADGMVETVSRFGLPHTFEARWARKDILETAWNGATPRVRSGAFAAARGAKSPGAGEVDGRTGPDHASLICVLARDRRADRCAGGPIAGLRISPARETGVHRHAARQARLRQGHQGNARPPPGRQARPRALGLMVASIGAVASPSQEAHYYEADGYYAKNSPEHLAASAWAGRGPEDGDRHLPASNFPEPRPGAAHPFGDRQHAAGRRRQVADDGQREPVCLEDADGRFEIAGVSRETIEAFSTRRAEIEAAMDGRGLGSTAENQHLARRAALMTRASKRDVDREALHETWKSQAAELGFDAKALVASAKEPARDAVQADQDAVRDCGPNGAQPPDLGPLFAHAAQANPAHEAVDWALAHLSEHDAPALEGGSGLITYRAVAQERETVALMRSGAGRSKAPMRGWTVDRHLRKGPLTAGQKQAVKLILSEKDRTVGVQGYAGTGKTRMLNRARTLAEKKGAKEMRAAFAKTILVVDEGSLASTIQTRDLLRIAGDLRIPKLVLVGDSKQLDAVDAGKPFAQLQAAGMKTAVMDEIMRQRDPDLKAAVEASLAGEIGKAFEKLGSNVAEVNPDNIAGAVAARWLELSAEERERTGVMAPSHELREGINAHIRERLAHEGRIAGPILQTQRLVSKGYTNAEKALVSNYAPGDVMAFHRPYRRLGVEKGDERRVESVDHSKRTVYLEGPDGAAVAWKPSEIGGRRGSSEVYRAETVELRAGDRIRWTRNDKGLGLVNSGTAEVMGVRNGRVTFILEGGRKLTLTPGDPQLRHLDHAWASTVHAFQGRTVDNVIAALEVNHPQLTTAKAFYVEISRARDRAELVTDDAQALRERLEAVTGERISALEGIGESVQPGRERGQEKDGKTLPDYERPGPEPSAPEREIEPAMSRQKVPETEPSARGKHIEADLSL